jgi:hypothetical protein
MNAITKSMELEQDKIDKGNRLIVKYFGYFADKDAVVVNMRGYAYDQLKFHESYDWIMPIVHKICEQISNRSVPSSPIEMYARKIATMHLNNSVESIWHSVVDYIAWYNSDEAKNVFAMDDELRMHYTKK